MEIRERFKNVGQHLVGCCGAVACIVSRTGRLLAPFSAYPGEEEIVLLPGIVLLPVLSYRSDTAGVDVVVLEAP